MGNYLMDLYYHLKIINDDNFLLIFTICFVKGSILSEKNRWHKFKLNLHQFLHKQKSKDTIFLFHLNLFLVKFLNKCLPTYTNGEQSDKYIEPVVGIPHLCQDMYPRFLGLTEDQNIHKHKK